MITPKIRTQTLLDSVTITASGSETKVVDAPQWLETIGNFGLHLVVSGSGTLSVELDQSNTNETGEWVTETIESGITAGNSLIEMNPTLSAYMKLKFTETGGSDSVTVKATLAYQ